MKKTVLMILILALISQSFCFAYEEPVKAAAEEETERVLFRSMLTTTGGDPLYESMIRSLSYSETEDAYYLLLNDRGTDETRKRGHQWVYSATDGTVVMKPEYPELSIQVDGMNRNLRRRDLSINGFDAYSIEEHWVNGQRYMTMYQYTAEVINKTVLDASRYFGFVTQNNHFAYRLYDAELRNYSRIPIFHKQIGVLSGFDNEQTMHIWDTRFDMVTGYDLTSDGSELIYGGVLPSENPWGEEIHIVRFDGTEPMDYHCENGEGVVSEFSLTLPEKPEDLESGAGRIKLKQLSVSDLGIVVLFEVGATKENFVQRYTTDGQLQVEIPLSKKTAKITEGRDGTLVLLQESKDMVNWRNTHWEAVEMKWPEPKKEATTQGSRSTPKPLLKERPVGETTFAGYEKGRFGLLKRSNQETNTVDYLIPVRSHTSDLRIRIPYEDLAARSSENAALVVTLEGKEISIPMNVFACQKDLANMPCQTGAAFEIRIGKTDQGSVEPTIDLIVVEQVDAKTKWVHRKPIQ